MNRWLVQGVSCLTEGVPCLPCWDKLQPREWLDGWILLRICRSYPLALGHDIFLCKVDGTMAPHSGVFYATHCKFMLQHYWGLLMLKWESPEFKWMINRSSKFSTISVPSSQYLQCFVKMWCKACCCPHFFNVLRISFSEWKMNEWMNKTSYVCTVFRLCATSFHISSFQCSSHFI